MTPRRLLAAAAAAALALSCAACAPTRAADGHLTFRLWDPQVAEAYRSSFAAFTASTGIRVDTVVVPWADYAAQLRADLAAGTGDDLFWVNATMAAGVQPTGAILPVPQSLVDASGHDWAAPVVGQYTRDGQLWAVPQLSDPGIAVVVNLDLLAKAGMDAGAVSDLAWDPSAPDDSLRRTARLLTTDADGRHPGDAGFDAGRVTAYGFGSAFDLNGVVLPFLGGAGAAWQDGDRFVFGSDAGVSTLSYLSGLAASHVAPPARDTNPPSGGDVVRDLFLEGQVAMFPTGAYSLAAIAEAATFRWAVVPLPSGPAGRHSPVNGIGVAANAHSADTADQARLWEWLGSAESQRIIGASGTASPASVPAQDAYRLHWQERGVDISAMFDVLKDTPVQPPQGVAYQAAANALTPILADVFSGAEPAAEGVRRAEDAANAASAP